MKIELIKKLRLKKGCKYLLFLPEEFRREAVEDLMNKLEKFGWSDSLAVLVNDPNKIKVIEK